LAICSYCKKPAGFFQSKHRDCEELHYAKINILRSTVDTGIWSNIDLSLLQRAISELTVPSSLSQTDIRNVLIRAWIDYVETKIDKDGIDAATEARLIEFQNAFSLTQDELDQTQTYEKLIKALVLRDLANGKWSTRVKIEGRAQLNLETDEQIVWMFQDTPLWEDKTHREYVGGSIGLSARVGKGVYVHTGPFRGQPVENTNRIISDTGIAAFTNKNIYFVGEKKSFRIPYRKIIAYVPFTDGIGLMRDTANSKIQILMTGDGWFSYNLAMALSQFKKAAAEKTARVDVPTSKSPQIEADIEKPEISNGDQKPNPKTDSAEETRPQLGLEDSLNLAFANKLLDSPEFIAWVLGHTKFSQYAAGVRLLKDEQEKARRARFWWRHWWCRIPESGEDSETDIFLVFEVIKSGMRFAVHIENKIAGSTFTPRQEFNYAARALHMLSNTKSASFKCTDFDTVLIAPTSFRDRFSEPCSQFGCFISHEDISKFIPSFGNQ